MTMNVIILIEELVAIHLGISACLRDHGKVLRDN